LVLIKTLLTAYKNEDSTGLGMLCLEDGVDQIRQLYETSRILPLSKILYIVRKDSKCAKI